jgi:hypothetical protein
MRGSRRQRVLATGIVTTALLTACGDGGGIELGPSETFQWTDQAISFSVPADSWQRQALNGSDRRGVGFHIGHGPGGRISLSEYWPLNDRNTLPRLRRLVDEYYTLEWDKALPALNACYLPRRNHTSQYEAEIARTVNSQLERASDFHRRKNRVRAGRVLVEALEVLERLRYSLDEVVVGVRIDPGRFEDPDRFQHIGDRRGVVAGVSALWVDYIYSSPSRTYTWREVYFLKDTHLFVASYQGPRKHLELFETVVRSITFPTEENQQ